MEIQVEREGAKVNVKLAGRLDTNTSPELERCLTGLFAEKVSELNLDMSELVYVSSAGLRVLLGAQKTMNAGNGAMVLRGVSADIMEVFEMTGFVDILTIE